MSTENISYCCTPFKDAYENGVINKPHPAYRTHEGLQMDKFYLWDRDCGEVDVKVPIKFCPYCGCTVRDPSL